MGAFLLRRSVLTGMSSAQIEAYFTASPAAPSITEGDASSANLAFGLVSSRAWPDPMLIDYATSGGTATAGVDYTAASGTLTLARGATSVSVNIAVFGDTAEESDETFNVVFSNFRKA